MTYTIYTQQPTPGDIDILHPLLRESYWSPGIPRDTVENACAHSKCVIARDATGGLIGFARAITDGAVFAWICDVMVVPERRGEGIGRALVSELVSHPELKTVRRFMLGTLDAHGVYAGIGFGPIKAPERLMEILRPAHYAPPKA
jgi:GNAT superfamily N-acetyltransferase